MIARGPQGERSEVGKSWPFGNGSPSGRWGTSMYSNWWGVPSPAVSYATLYQTQPWVFVVVNKLARAIARLPLHVFELDSESGDRIRDRESSLVELLRAPYTLGANGEGPRASGFRLTEHLIASVAIYGNALALKQRTVRGGPPDELWPLDWRRAEMFTAGPDGPVSYYTYQQEAGPPALLRAEDVVHLMWWGPDGLGISPLEPLRSALANEIAAQRYSTASFENGVRPSGALITPKRLGQDQKAQIQSDIEVANSGVDRAGRMLLLDGGLDWKPFGGTAVDAQMVEARSLNRDEVCAVYDIPPPMVGILDRATFSNVDEQHRMLYQDTLGPWLVNYEQTLQTQLVDLEPAWRGRFCEFAMDEVLRGDVEKRSQAYQRFLTSAVYTPNELRRMENLPAVDNELADCVYVPMNMTAVGDQLSQELGAPLPGQAAALLRELAAASNGHTD